MSFPRYADCKDSGIEWLGEVPSHWGLVPVKHLARFFSGGTPSKENEDYWEGEIPWASAKDMKVDVLSNTEDHITDFAIEQGAATLLDRGTVLIVVRGMILARTFPVCLTRAPMAINQDLKGLVAGPRILPGFLAWYLRGTADESLRRLDEAGHGTKALRMDAWSSLPVALPPLPEQALVVAFLDRETARIDGLIAEQERLIALAKEKRQAVISHAVTKGLNPTVPMKDSGIDWLGEVPEHWNLLRVKHTIHAVEQGWSPQCDGFAAEPDEWGVLKVGCVNGGVFNPGENKRLPDDLDPIPELSIKIGDVLISRANTRELVGGVVIVSKDFPKLLLCDKLYRLRTHDDICNPAFLARYLMCGVARAQIELAATGASSSMLNIAQSTILDMSIAVPSLAEQVAIVAHLDTETAKLDALAAEAERAIDLLREHRAALIAAAVTGKIDVRGLAEAA